MAYAAKLGEGSNSAPDCIVETYATESGKYKNNCNYYTYFLDETVKTFKLLWKYIYVTNSGSLNLWNHCNIAWETKVLLETCPAQISAYQVGPYPWANKSHGLRAYLTQK